MQVGKEWPRFHLPEQLTWKRHGGGRSKKGMVEAARRGTVAATECRYRVHKLPSGTRRRYPRPHGGMGNRLGSTASACVESALKAHARVPAWRLRKQDDEGCNPGRGRRCCCPAFSGYYVL